MKPRVKKFAKTLFKKPENMYNDRYYGRYVCEWRKLVMAR